MSLAPALARGCGKVCHPDKQSAQEHADVLIRQCRLAGDRVEIAIYQCTVCPGTWWHVGRRKGPGFFNSRKRGRRL